MNPAGALLSPIPSHPPAANLPRLSWVEDGRGCSAAWRSERGVAPPKRVEVVDDTLPADVAYRLACAGTALLWRGDFHNARQLLQALQRRIDQVPERKRRGPAVPEAAPASPSERFHRYRMAQGQRARLLGALLIPFAADHSVPLRRAPDVRSACAEAWGAPTTGAALPADAASQEAVGAVVAGVAAAGPVVAVASLRELLGIVAAHEWRRRGIELPALAKLPQSGGRTTDRSAGSSADKSAGERGRIHPHYGVFSPVRGEYVDLVAQASWPGGVVPTLAFDLGAGTGVLCAVLAARGVPQVIATELDPRALACAADNLQRLGFNDRVTLQAADLYPVTVDAAGHPLRADLVVCNPPWLPGRPASPLEHAIYDEGSRMLRGFLAGLSVHLRPGGEGWLILSDLAEHLGLRSRQELLQWIEASGLRVLDRLDIRPRHPKSSSADDPLHFARRAEVTSLWRLAVQG
jgi:SAM-dependent methyltransferase